MSDSNSSDARLKEVLLVAAEHMFACEDEVPLIDVDTKGQEGDSPLHLFVWRGDPDSAKVLIQAGADVNAVGDKGETPLHVAIRRQDKALVVLLLSTGARSDIRSEFNKTPQEAAALIGGELAELFLPSLRGA